MTDLDAKIDELLTVWHNRSSGYSFVAGYASASPMFRDVKSNWSYHDRSNGVVTDVDDRSLVRAIGSAIMAVPNDPEPWRTCLMLEARNLALGLSVWSSARLPADREEREVIRLEARVKFAHQARKQGVLG